jgi:hypothetical protein
MIVIQDISNELSIELYLRGEMVALTNKGNHKNVWETRHV